jgi:hypothetical protein
MSKKEVHNNNIGLIYFKDWKLNIINYQNLRRFEYLFIWFFLFKLFK